MSSVLTGLVKPKKYDWKDSNLALFGSDTEKEVKSKLNPELSADLFIFVTVCPVRTLLLVSISFFSTNTHRFFL